MSLYVVCSQGITAKNIYGYIVNEVHLRMKTGIDTNFLTSWPWQVSQDQVQGQHGNLEYANVGRWHPHSSSLY